MKISTKKIKEQVLHLPTSARPYINPEDINVTEGYKVEIVAAGLSFPTEMGFDVLVQLDLGENYIICFNKTNKLWVLSQLLSN